MLGVQAVELSNWREWESFEDCQDGHIWLADVRWLEVASDNGGTSPGLICASRRHFVTVLYICDGFLAERDYKIIVDDLDRPAIPAEMEDNWFLVYESWTPEGTVLIRSEVENVPQLRNGLINKILYEVIFIMVVRAPWKFFHLTTVLLLCRDVTLRWNTLYFLFDSVLTISVCINLVLHKLLMKHYRDHLILRIVRDPGVRWGFLYYCMSKQMRRNIDGQHIPNSEIIVWASSMMPSASNEWIWKSESSPSKEAFRQVSHAFLEEIFRCLRKHIQGVRNE
jgi:hypothetical protein